MAGPAHVSRVRFLYKRLLVLHRFLPIDLRALGDQYVKDEFRRHKSASPENVTRFMAEWEVTRAPNPADTCPFHFILWLHDSDQCCP
ncbi:hypothetical protein CesoFtcFv8_020376 [Champsocephalus esox]|uniref:Succinate dehydrogenase assembly factor 3 n=1 Tax=Champsocephalus esox TaxID=159716 RepID=A0AAN8BF84_9TELE|nr:hypothetical protein CesoFtcFv8_020376 [Champsocephalus esox]